MNNCQGDGEATGTHVHQRMQIFTQVVAGVPGEIMVSNNYFFEMNIQFTFFHVL